MVLDGKVFRIDYTRTPRQLRVAGVVTAVLGTVALAGGLFFLCLGSATFAEHLLYPLFPGLRPENVGEDKTNAGALLLGAIVSLYGVVAISASAYQIVFGRRAMLLVRIMIAMVLLLFLMGGIAALMTGQRVPGVV